MLAPYNVTPEVTPELFALNSAGMLCGHVVSLFVFVLKCLMCELQHKSNATLDMFIVVVFVTYLLFGT